MARAVVLVVTQRSFGWAVLAYNAGQAGRSIGARATVGACPHGSGRLFLTDDCEVTGRDRRKLQFAVLAAAAGHGGVGVDLLDEVAHWQTDDFWRYAAYTAIAYIRVAADRAGVPEPEVCRGLAQTRDG